MDTDTLNTAPKRKPGAPRSEFDQKIADRICDKIIEGKSLRRICTEKWAPSKRIVLRWLEENPKFAAQYARAREEQADSYADELIELARKADSTNAHAIRVQVDTIKWVVSKLKPKKYGDRAALDIQADVQVRQEEVTPIELARRMLWLVARTNKEAPIEEFISAQVFLLNHVAEQIADRGGGSTREGFYAGRYGHLAKGITDLAEIVAGQLRGEQQTAPSLPAPKPAEKDVNPAPESGPITRARAREDGVEDDVEVIE